MAVNSAHAQEIAAGRRFEFGRNWRHFLRTLNEERIAAVVRSLQEDLRIDNLAGLRFLDMGSGSGVVSLAARRLGAEVRSVDYDPLSVACTQELKHRYFPDDEHWHVQQGSVLDREFLAGLGSYDVVYSWGVLHHTGDMHTALEHIALPVREGGRLFIAIYNDQGLPSRLWTLIKRTYVRSPWLFKGVILGLFSAWQVATRLVYDLLRLRAPWRRYVEYHRNRGMSIWYDWVDWVGGYPFEVAKPEQIFSFYFQRGFALEHLRTAGGRLGNNEFVFRRNRP